MSNNNNSSGFWTIVICAVVGTLIAQMFGGSSSTSNTSTPPANTGSVEYRYAKERFRQEGYSDADSATAAEAVLKFHNAQQARQNK